MNALDLSVLLFEECRCRMNAARTSNDEAGGPQFRSKHDITLAETSYRVKWLMKMTLRGCRLDWLGDGWSFQKGHQKPKTANRGVQ